MEKKEKKKSKSRREGILHEVGRAGKLAPVPKLAPMPIFLHGQNLHHTNAKIGTNACSNAKINAKIGIVPKLAPMPMFANFRIMRILAPIFLLFFFHSSSAPVLLQFLFCSCSSKLQYGFKLSLDSSCSALSSVWSEDGEVFGLQNYQNTYKMLLVTQ